MVGTSIAASLKHHDYGHIDYKLAIWLLAGSIVGAEVGAQILMWLHGMGDIIIRGHSISVMSVCVDIIFIVLLLTVGIVMFIESNQATQREPRGGVVKSKISRKDKKYRDSAKDFFSNFGNKVNFHLECCCPRIRSRGVVRFIGNRRRIYYESLADLSFRNSHQCRSRDRPFSDYFYLRLRHSKPFLKGQCGFYAGGLYPMRFAGRFATGSHAA